MNDDVLTLILETQEVSVLRLVCKRWNRLTLDRYKDSPHDITFDEYISTIKSQRHAILLLYWRACSCQAPITLDEIRLLVQRSPRFIDTVNEYNSRGYGCEGPTGPSGVSGDIGPAGPTEGEYMIVTGPTSTALKHGKYGQRMLVVEKHTKRRQKTHKATNRVIRL